MSAAEQLSYAPLPYRVRRRIRETSDTWTLELDPVGAAIELAPGQFTMLYAFGVGEVPISVSGDLTCPGPLVHTIRAVGAVTERLCALRRGDVLGVRGPFGHGWPLERAEEHDLILVAGGVGLPPLRPVLYDVLHHRGLYDRVALLYGARTPGDLVFRHELEEWRTHPDLHVDWTVDVGDGSCKEGLVTTLVPDVTFDPVNTVAFACGPEIMMRNAVRALGERGLPPESVYVSLERNMRCGVGLCGHCQLGPTLICRDGPVYPWPEVAPLMAVSEL